MKKIYYFSEKNLKFIEIKNFNRKFFLLVLFISLTLSSLIFGIYFTLDHYLNPGGKIQNLKAENKELRKKIKELARLYKELGEKVDSIEQHQNFLRIAANLKPKSSEERELGIGGGEFLDFDIFNLNEEKLKIQNIENFVNSIQTKIKFEIDNFIEIDKKIKDNPNLYESIPAIRPCEGEIGMRGFGLRLHPILGVVKFHEGIDIITDIGTPVYAPGNGIVKFVGRKGGYGLALIIDHGYGYETVYAHLSRIVVKYKQKVQRGDIIAYTGNSGISTGPHLHYEVRHNEVKLDPELFFFEDLTIFDYFLQGKKNN